jgi:hypothetical protein
MIAAARIALFNAVKISPLHLITFCPTEKLQARGAPYLLM